MTLDALTPASVHSLWSSPKCLNLLCLTVFSSLRSSLLLVHIFLQSLFLPVNFAFIMLWYSTLWTATPFSNDLLWLLWPLCGGCQWLSSGPLASQPSSPLLWFQRTRDTRNLYCRDGHLMKLKCRDGYSLHFIDTAYRYRYLSILFGAKRYDVKSCWKFQVILLLLNLSNCIKVIQSGAGSYFSLCFFLLTFKGKVHP